MRCRQCLKGDLGALKRFGGGTKPDWQLINHNVPRVGAALILDARGILATLAGSRAGGTHSLPQCNIPRRLPRMPLAPGL